MRTRRLGPAQARRAQLVSATSLRGTDLVEKVYEVFLRARTEADPLMASVQSLDGIDGVTLQPLTLQGF